MNSQVIATRTRLHSPPGGPVLEEQDGESRKGRAVLTPARLMLPRMRYYVELLTAGYRQAVRPEALPRCLRAERIALGIDLPELDAGPLWAACGPDLTVSIPFADFVLGRIHHILGRFVECLPSADREVGSDLWKGCLEYRRILEGLKIEDAGPDNLPRLEDCRLPQPSIDRLCGPGGLLFSILEDCERVLWLETVGSERR